MDVREGAGPLTPLQNAVYLLKQAQAKLAAHEHARSEPIAIVGIGCRFPGGCDDAGAYWRLLCDGVDAIEEVPADRWNTDDYYDPDPTAPGKMNTRWGGFVKHVSEFDAEFFGISPREAVRVDPQHRLLLEVAWEALEDAGLPAGRIAQTKTGVYVGVIGSDYALLQSKDLCDMDVFTGTGGSHAILANRLSYFLNVNGPSIALDTACSSSLVTVHLACQSLRRRETDLALAGGVNLILGPEMTMALTKAHMMAPDGRCKAFDAAADGYVRGEGCGMVVLKRLSDALADGDRVIAIIRGTAVNHDGRSNGLSAPNGPAQEAVIRAALTDAHLAPTDIGYVETHGTGTRLGDPIEIEALRTVLGAGRSSDWPLVVGSVKTNIGHLESAAGIAGLIKAALMLREGRIPAHLHLHTVNPLLQLEDSPLEIPATMRDWPRGAEPRRAGVSAFGFGGTNAHVILEEADVTPKPERTPERPRHLLTLSARSVQAISDLAVRYADFAEAKLVAEGDNTFSRRQNGDGTVADTPPLADVPSAAKRVDLDREQYSSPLRLADVVYTANTGREHFSHRAAVAATSLGELRDRLRAMAADPSAVGVYCGQCNHDRPPRIGFLFTGQGAQYAGMGRALYETQPTFRAAIDACAELLRSHLDRPLLDLLDPQVGSLLNQTGYTQPVMFAVEYALANLWRSWGIEPAVVMGHSVGELAAACVAGVFSLEDGLGLIAQRARLMQSLPAGGLMAAVFAAEPRVTAALEAYRNQVQIAALNGPESIVISGDEPAVQEVLTRLANEGVKSKTLATSHAFHSHRMEPMLDELRRAAESVACSPPTIDIVSNLTGRLADSNTYRDPAYWSRHARMPVRFAESILAMAERGCEVFLEIGPSPTLIGMGQRCLAEGDYAWLPSLRAGRDDWHVLLDTLGRLYVRGAKVDWAGFDRDYERRKTELPKYPFQRKHYWANVSADAGQHGLSTPRRNGRVVGPLLGPRLVTATSEQVFESQLSANRPAMLADHKIQDTVIMPAAGFLEMALAASAALHGACWTVRGLALLEPLLLDKTPRTVQTIVCPEGGRAAAFRIVSVTSGNGDAEPSFITHASGHLESPEETVVPALDVESLRSRFAGEPRDEQWRIEALGKSGIEPGPNFLWLHHHWIDNGEGLANFRETRESDRAGEYRIHPGLLDAAFQLLGGVLPGAGDGIDAYVPMGIDRLQTFEPWSHPAWCAASLRSLHGKVAVGDVQMLDGSGRVLVKLDGVRLSCVPRDWLARRLAGPLPDWCYELAWIEDSPRQLKEEQDVNATVSPLPTNLWSVPGEGPGVRAVDSEPRRWLIFDTQDRLGIALAERLELKGHRCNLVAADGDAEARRSAVREFLAGTLPERRDVVYLSGLDVDGSGDTPDFVAARERGWGGALDIVQALVESSGAAAPRLWLVTRGAQAVGNRQHPLCLAQSPLWGLGRVIASEHPNLACSRIDLDPENRDDAADQLAEELLLNVVEDQVAYRDGRRWAARLRRLRHDGADSLEFSHGQPYRLDITSRGQLDNVALRPASRVPPGPGEVEIRVRAAGLNFRDVLNVLDLYPGDPGPLGGECAGEITAVGDGVERLKTGDQVVALAPASFASYVLTRADFVVPKPAHLSLDESVTIPICFVTAHLALRRLAQLRKGERVLIHAAAGGVGMAAIQVARQTGAEIFATAGSPRKREYLKRLGIVHVMDSRSLDFADEIMRITNGAGIDVVLNSLTGETIGASLSVLRPGGRFLELGKTDLWDQRRVDETRPGVAFHAIALDQMMAQEPETVRQLMREVVSEFVERTLEPLPLRTFPISRLIDALRHMARAEHIGKIVIRAAHAEFSDHGFSLREDGAYLVTGGLGGLGLKVARWLADRGARHIVLVGRSGASAEADSQLAELKRLGIGVAVRKCDIGNRQDAAALLADIRAERPLRGVFHLAGVLDDGVLREQTRERFDRVMASKALGAWHLHDLTRDDPLDLFVLFSSAAALLGAPGQGNYAAANAFLDALAHQRQWEGRPALSVNWGSWAQVGMAAKLIETEGRRWAAAGVGWIEPNRGLHTLEHLIADQHTQAGVLPIDWPKFFARIPPDSEPAWLTEMAHAARESQPTDSPADANPVLLEELKNVTPAERLELALTHIRKQAARVLAIDEANLPDPRRTLNELGFDSLTAVEFANRVGRSVGQHLNPAILFDYPTLESLAGHVVRDMLHLETEAAPAEAATEATVDEVRAQTAADVEGMSDDEMEALVAQQLERLQQ